MSAHGRSAPWTRRWLRPTAARPSCVKPPSWQRPVPTHCSEQRAGWPARREPVQRELDAAERGIELMRRNLLIRAGQNKALQRRVEDFDRPVVALRRRFSHAAYARSAT